MGSRRAIGVALVVVVLSAAACGEADAPGSVTAAAGGATATAPSATAAPSTTTTTAPPPPRERVTLAFTGDLLPHEPVVAQAQAYGAASGVAYDFRPMFDQVRPLLSKVDVALCHLEVPVSADNSLIAGYPAFSGPREMGQAIESAGYEGCSTASNHSLDQAAAGVVSTLNVLDADHVGHSGTARTAEEQAAPVLYETADGVVVGHVSAAYGFNGYVPDMPWRVRDLDPDPLIAAAGAARQAGADLVVASLHWGLEYQHDPTAEQLALAEQLTASGAFDLIVGHHAHVVQPIRRLNGVPVIFGLGNLLSNMSDIDARDGVIVRVRAIRDAVDSPWRFDIAVTPTWVDLASFSILPVAATLGGPGGAALEGELRASWDRTIAVMTADGVAHPAGSLPG